MSALKPRRGPLVTLNAKDAAPRQVTPTRNEVAPPPGPPGLGLQKPKRPATGLAGQDLGGVRTWGDHRKAARQAWAPRDPRGGPGPSRPGAGRLGRERGLNTALRRGGATVRAGLLRDPRAPSCDPLTTFADSWSPSVGCACRSELAHWRGPGTALISLVQLRPGIS